MTCIVGLVSAGQVFIGGDSAGVAGWNLRLRADAKVFKNGDYLFGFTSSFRMGQLLRYALQIPKRHPDKDLMAFMATDFIDAVRNCLKAGGFARKDSETEQGGVFLVGHAGRLFYVDCDYQVGEVRGDYDACGCGEAYACGALYVNSGLGAEDRIRQALLAAEAHSAGVRGPFHIESI